MASSPLRDGLRDEPPSTAAAGYPGTGSPERRGVVPPSIVLDRSGTASHAPEDDEDATVTISRIAAYVKNSSIRAMEVDDMERVVLDRDGAINKLRAQLDQKNADLHREREEHRRQLVHLTREKETAQKAAAEAAELKADYERLHNEYNSALHNSLSMQREAAQLRTELLDLQSRGSRDERQKLREERWEMERVHSEEMATLRKRIDVLKDEHAGQIVKLQASFEEDRKELLRRLSHCVPKSEMDTLRNHLRHTENELAIANRRKTELMEEAQDLVPLSSLEAAEAEQTRRGEQVTELMEELANERTARRTDQEQLVGLSRLSQDLTHKVTHLNSTLAAKDAEASSLLQRLHVAQHETEALRDKYDLLSRYHRESERTVESLRRDADAAAQDAQKSTAALELAREEHGREKTRLEAQLGELTSSSHTTREELVSLKTQAAGMQSRISILESDLDNQTSKAIAQQRDASTKLEQLSRQTYALQDQLHQTMSQKEKADMETARLHRALEDADAQCASLLGDRKTCEDRVAQLLGEADLLRKSREDADERIAELKAKLKSRGEQIHSLNDKLKTHERLMTEHLKPYFSAAKKAGLMM